MRARSIKPGICDNELLGTADPFYTLLFERLWMMADREGRLEDRPLRIKAQAFPYRDGLDVEPMLQWLTDHGFILRYSHGTDKYIQVLKFGKHQSPHIKEAKSTIPAPVQHQSSPVLPPEIPAPAHLTPSSLTPDSGLLTPDSVRYAPRVQVTESEVRQRMKVIRDAYPKGSGRIDWLTAEHHLRLRINEGETWDSMEAVVRRYASWCLATAKVGTQFVLAPHKFFSAPDRPWLQPWDLPATKADTRLAGNLSAADEFMRRTETTQ